MDLQALIDNPLPDREQDYDVRDTILYALGLGYGHDPDATDELLYTYEKNLQAVPTMACVLAHPGFWYQNPNYKVDWVKLLHGGQTIEMVRPLPPSGRVKASYKVISVDDKGAEKGAVLTQEKVLSDAVSGELIGRIRSVTVLRGDGGCGSFGDKAPAVLKPPQGDPPVVVDVPTSLQAALLYRLNGDLNPIHADPEIARKAGFPRPILHGLCTMGVACRGLLATLCDDDPMRLARMSVRFTKPVFPGETLRLEAWPGGTNILFRLRAVERDLLVMDSCEATLRAA
jgi:acyl dehydratase